MYLIIDKDITQDDVGFSFDYDEDDVNDVKSGDKIIIDLDTEEVMSVDDYGNTCWDTILHRG